MSDEHDQLEHQTGRKHRDPEPAPEEQAERNHMEHHDTHDHGHPESTQGEVAEHGDHGTVSELHEHGVEIAEDAIGVPADLQEHTGHDEEHKGHADHTGHEEMFRRRF